MAILAVLAAVALLVPRAADRPLESWQAVPTVADPAMVADATPRCLPGGGNGTARLLVHDQRGPTAALAFIQGDSLITCVASRGSNGSIDSAVFAVGRAPTATDDLAVVSGMSSPTGPTDPGLRVIVGVARKATSVTLQRTDGVVVTATVRNGYFLAWWPTPVKASVITGFDGAGTRLEQLQDIEGGQP